ncbi:MAG: hypothetical protein AVDCRST_MAG93-1631 [uncultured Chloroflexia bacterium]|uniref:Uncharacterized protein n=1 Tax=uncultured Chloroflexia bacterium TaxID=1672391 RepID=A0A6J4IE33_9CHLR|nr:MAG: hypothetical protein AVDCRST_MAG93-1631 [uncultured Chloroflexia bacterium]
MSPSLDDFLNLVDTLELPDLPYPYLHTDRALIKLFLYGLVRSIVGFKTLHTHLQERPDVLDLMGLDFSTSPHNARQAFQELV